MEKSIGLQKQSIEQGGQFQSSVGRNQKITHQGVVETVEGSHVRVNIVQVAACGSCKARSMCATSDSKEKIIDVYEQGAEMKYKSGDQVMVCGALSMGKQAVRLAFAIPLLLIAVWMVISMVFLKMSELTSVGILAAILFVYFYVLYLNREKIAKRFAFWIE